MYLYRITTPQGYIFDEVLYFWLKPDNYPFGNLEIIKELNKDEAEEYNKSIRLLEKLTVSELIKGWNKYKITTPKGFTFETILPSGLDPGTYLFGLKVEIIREVSEDEQICMWEEHLPEE